MQRQIIFYLLFSFLFTFIVSAQENSFGFADKLPSVHALIIGISDYKNINDLQFADDDALAFEQYLKQTVKSKSDSNNIQVLLNEEAISPNIYAALENLIAKAKEKDKVYIYFSGHGDSENSTIFKSGFLLTHETPKHSYYTNSINIDILNNFVSTLSINNKAEVIFIVDACHSGNVNSAVDNGAVTTAKALSKNVAEEVRMLSCQPNEISLEGEQWGNGRGLFSYHLINGLWGLADLQGVSDGKVTLNELNIYLSTNVPKDAHPVSQYPGVYGPMSKQIGYVNETFIANYEKEKIPMITHSTNGANSKSFSKEQAVLTEEQNFLVKKYNQAIALNKLRGDESDDAYYFLQKLETSGAEQNIVSQIKRNFIAKLQEEPQLYINVLLDVSKRNKTSAKKLNQWAGDLSLAAELMGENHIFYNMLNSKSYFMKAAAAFAAIGDSKNDVYIKKQATITMREITKAIELDSLVTFYYTLKGAALNHLGGYKSAIEAFEQAIEINKFYPYAYANKGISLMYMQQFEASLQWFDKAIELDPSYTNAYLNKITALKKLGRIQETYPIYKEMIKNAEQGAKL